METTNKTITVQEYRAFIEIASRQKFYDHQLANKISYWTNCWNVFKYSEKLEKFLIEFNIKHNVENI